MLQREWYNASKKNSDDIATHIAELEDIAHRLKLMGEQIADSMIITKILMTLPAGYRHFVSAWESTSVEERTLENLKAKLITEESRHTSRKYKNGNALSSNAQQGKSRRGRGGEPRNTSKPGKFYVCGEPGHWARECSQRKGDDEQRPKKDPKKDDSTSKNKLYSKRLVCDALSLEVTQNVKVADWILDSGASDHMTSRRNWHVRGF
ncbi:uncharacterized protein [Temnothorax longispinosus]|uniref:uncharacterized protein n=1 Tax=Temnothorax longispinosus TaxID=300112 RepID=UPI003A9A3370